MFAGYLCPSLRPPRRLERADPDGTGAGRAGGDRIGSARPPAPSRGLAPRLPLRTTRRLRPHQASSPSPPPLHLQQREKRGPWGRTTCRWSARRREGLAQEAGGPDADADESAPPALRSPVAASPRHSGTPRLRQLPAENICCYPIAQGEACDTKSPTVQILAANISCYPIAQGEACDTNGAGLQICFSSLSSML